MKVFFLYDIEITFKIKVQIFDILIPEKKKKITVKLIKCVNSFMLQFTS